MTDASGSLADSRLLPTVTEANRFFWTGGAAGRLLLLRCGACGRWLVPPSTRCLACGGEPAPEPVSGRGTVFTYTVNRYPYNPAVPLPYVIAIVELVEQDDLRLITNVVNCDPERVAIGMPVRVLFEQHGDIYVPLFEPEESS